jgi:hypothetical protein
MRVIELVPILMTASRLSSNRAPPLKSRAIVVSLTPQAMTSSSSGSPVWAGRATFESSLKTCRDSPPRTTIAGEAPISIPGTLAGGAPAPICVPTYSARATAAAAANAQTIGATRRCVARLCAPGSGAVCRAAATDARIRVSRSAGGVGAASPSDSPDAILSSSPAAARQSSQAARCAVSASASAPASSPSSRRWSSSFARLQSVSEIIASHRFRRSPMRL